MRAMRIALANLPYPSSPDDAVARVTAAIPDAGRTGAPTTSAITNPDGTVLAWQPYGEAGLLVAELDLSRATRLVATRLRG